jgi:hypothetical protein
MNRQMEMAFMQEGGMKDDGMDKDPVSGNEIPAGSLAKEVRDDIPAQLSEGEYVVPADVVQYYGVKFFEDLRMQAKMGLAQMDRDGRIGGEPVAVAAIAIDGGEEELDPEDEKKLMEILGEPVKADQGVLTDADYHQAAQTAMNTDPLSNFQYFGQKTMQQGTPSLARKETWYHPDGSERVVEYDATGNVTPPLDVQYTQPPWSKNKPSGVEQSLEQAASPTKKDKPPVEFIDAIGIIDPKNNNPVRMTQDNYDALEKSFLRLKGKGGINTIQDYYDLDFASRIKLIPAELGANISEDAIQAIVDNSNDPEKMNLFEKVFGASLFGQAVSAILNVGKSFVEGLIKPIIVNLTGNSDEVKKIVADSSSSDKSEEQIRKEAEEKIETQRKIDKTPTAVGASEMTKEAEERTTATGTVSADKNIAAGDYSFLNKGGLLTKPKRKPKKPRGKGLASR